MPGLLTTLRKLAAVPPPGARQFGNSENTPLEVVESVAESSGSATDSARPQALCKSVDTFAVRRDLSTLRHSIRQCRDKMEHFTHDVGFIREEHVVVRSHEFYHSPIASTLKEGSSGRGSLFDRKLIGLLERCEPNGVFRLQPWWNIAGGTLGGKERQCRDCDGYIVRLARACGQSLPNSVRTSPVSNAPIWIHPVAVAKFRLWWRYSKLPLPPC